MADYRNDVVHRLQDRAFASEQVARVVSNTHYHLRDNNHGRDATLMREAADEIERLRAEAALFKSELDRANARCAEEHSLRELAERELAALRERIASLQSAIEKAPSVDGARMTYIEQDRVLDQLYELSREGHRVRLVRED